MIAPDFERRQQSNGALGTIWITHLFSCLNYRLCLWTLIFTIIYSWMQKIAKKEIQRWLGEVKAVNGQISILWHPHTLSEDYGWRDGFKEVLGFTKEMVK